MYTNPKNVTEQLMNLVERLAIEMRIIANSLKNVVLKSDLATLKALAFKDTITIQEVDVMNPSPKEIFDAFMNKENNNG
mgnify:CR=1 FL=1